MATSSFWIVLYQNNVLSGGSTEIAGLPERLEKEVKDLAPLSSNVKVVAPKERKYSVWIGGSILASLSSFRKCWISSESYNEGGDSLLRSQLQF